MSNIDSLLNQLPKEVQEELTALLGEELKDEKTSPLEKPSIPFTCPVCQWRGWEVREVVIAKLDASNSLVRPHSVEEISSTWTFGCGHQIRNSVGVGAEVVEEGEEEKEEEDE